MHSWYSLVLLTVVLVNAVVSFKLRIYIVYQSYPWSLFSLIICQFNLKSLPGNHTVYRHTLFIDNPVSSITIESLMIHITAYIDHFILTIINNMQPLTKEKLKKQLKTEIDNTFSDVPTSSRCRTVRPKIPKRSTLLCNG